MASAIFSLSDSLRDGIAAVKQHDFTQEAVDFLLSDDLDWKLPATKIAAAMTVFLDERKAKMYCLMKDLNTCSIFLEREIEMVLDV
jgi:hypothetical protein